MSGQDLSKNFASQEDISPAVGRGFRRAIRRELRSVFVVSAFINLLMLTSSVYMLQVLDRVLSSASISTLIYLTVIAILALFVYGLLEMTRRQILSRVGAYCDEQMAPAVLNKILLRSAAGDKQWSNALVSLNAFKSFLSGENIIAFLDAPWTPFFLIAIALIHPWLGIVAGAGLFVLFLVSIIHDLVARPMGLKQQAEQSEAFGLAREASASAEASVVMDLRTPIVSALRQNLAASFDKHRGKHDAISGLVAFSRFLRFTIQIAVLGVGAFLAISGEVTAGGIIAASILFGRAVGPIERSIAAWQAMIVAREGWRRCKTLLETKDTTEQLTLPEPEGRLELQNLTLSIPDRPQPLFSDLHGVIEAGSIVAVTGPSGSGKSTFARALLGLHDPARGVVTLDGIDVRLWRKDQLARSLGYLPQSVDLLSGTIAKNISRFSASPDAEQIVRAAQIAGIHDFIGTLPDGYNTMIGPEGRQISGGQYQRIGLARCLYGAPKLVILDEPTSAQDRAFKQVIISNLQNLRADWHTIVMMTHDPDLVAVADKVLELDGNQAWLYETGVSIRPITTLTEKIAQLKKNRVLSMSEDSRSSE